MPTISAAVVLAAIWLHLACCTYCGYVANLVPGVYTVQASLHDFLTDTVAGMPSEGNRSVSNTAMIDKTLDERPSEIS